MKAGHGLNRMLAAAVLCTVAVSTQASTVWDESLNGDFSNSGLSPTALIFAPGSNTVLGLTGNPGSGTGGVDRDYFSFVVPTGTQVTSIILLPNTFVSGSSGFMGIQAGPQLTVGTSGAGAENLLGYVHYENSMISTDILPTLLFFGGSSLPAGVYSVWVQELGGSVDYGLDFNVTQVPLPGAAGLLLSGMAAIGALRRRKAIRQSAD